LAVKNKVITQRGSNYYYDLGDGDQLLGAGKAVAVKTLKENVDILNKIDNELKMILLPHLYNEAEKAEENGERQDTEK
jgi:hypothetical protein